MDPMDELELRLAAFERVLEDTREEMRSGTWRAASIVTRMRERADAALLDDPTSLLGSALREFAEEMERAR